MRKVWFVLVITALSANWALAQTGSADAKEKSATRSITGCLEKSDNPNEFLLKANDGSSWKVRSDTVALSEHVGQTVSATGVVGNRTAHNMKEDTKDMAHDAGVKKNNAEHGHITVTELETVKGSCSQ
jgi:hypothetical protein